MSAFASLTRMLAACRLDRPDWLDEAEAAWAEVPRVARRRRAVFLFICVSPKAEEPIRPSWLPCG